MKNVFHKIDMETWPRAQIYHYFAEMVTTTTYSISVTMDVSVLKKTLQNRGLKFFPAYLYLISSVIKKQQEFRLSIQDGVLGYWDSLNPYYPVFCEDDQTIAFLWTAYDENFQRFYQCYLRDMEEHKNDRGVMPVKASPNNFIIACIPWFTFTSLSMHLQNAKNYYAPIFESGGFTEKDGATTMPLSITVNHATIDGYHIKVFLEALQRMMDHPEEWM